MVLGEVVRFVAAAGTPVNVELLLFGAVADPVETHVHGFGAFLLNIVVSNAGSCGVVRLE